jgi:hypothetical protein
MADSYSGYPLGFAAQAMDPYTLDVWGWLNPYVITDTTKTYQVTLGQASNFPGGADVYRGVKIQLPTGQAPRSILPWQGKYYWWGGARNLTNSRMTTKNPIAITGASPTLSFDLAYDIEPLWDFLWVQVSEDGTTWNVADTLTNANTTCDHDPDWYGDENGFPNDLCGAGLGGFTDRGATWPHPRTETFDLTPYAGKSICACGT